jgi:hypothetical protein
VAYLAERAREEAKERRAKRMPSAVTQMPQIRPKRQTPPRLPLLPMHAVAQR